MIATWCQGWVLLMGPSGGVEVCNICCSIVCIVMFLASILLWVSCFGLLYTSSVPQGPSRWVSLEQGRGPLDLLKLFTFSWHISPAGLFYLFFVGRLLFLKSFVCCSLFLRIFLVIYGGDIGSMYFSSKQGLEYFHWEQLLSVWLGCNDLSDQSSTALLINRKSHHRM